MSSYRTTRNVELSTIKYIDDTVSANWSGITIVKTFTQLEKSNPPVICVMLDDTNYVREELGNTAFMNTYIFNIDVYAKSDGQRIDLTDYLVGILVPGWVYYTADLTSGGARTLQYTQVGRCRLDKIISNNKVNIGSFGDAREKYRQNIAIAVTVGC